MSNGESNITQSPKRKRSTERMVDNCSMDSDFGSERADSCSSDFFLNPQGGGDELLDSVEDCDWPNNENDQGERSLESLLKHPIGEFANGGVELEKSCIRCFVVRTLTTCFLGGDLCHAVYFPSTFQQFPRGYEQCLEAISNGPKATDACNTWVIAVHKLQQDGLDR